MAEIESHSGRWVQLNVGDAKSGVIVGGLEKEGKEIDVLVNNARYWIFGAMECFEKDEVRRMMERPCMSAAYA
ncbi:hypothetical protein GQ43DRAFT_491994 [Delitschia confertaspora ATCC 74209]|uniref:Uncharacterized protein n=1 Tax=Delitschia confertaspora ATCC 74209 TaxID=1513339 RepID=A0A9P4MN96_9PLEO|nr:hypothetical protein GQ43DRAFT_491994 [Delitschia confertaspora ATCC 74209]